MKSIHFVLLQYQLQYHLFGYIEFALLIFIGGMLLNRLIKKPVNTPGKKKINAHHYFNFEDFQLSSKEFYDMVQQTIKDKTFPKVSTNTTTLSTGNIWAANREYLEVRSGDLTFIICAAPFGTNFFISWWLQEKLHSRIGRFFRWLGGYSSQKSYYQMDSALIFMEGIKAAIMKSVLKVTEAKGFRKLTQDCKYQTN